MKLKNKKTGEIGNLVLNINPNRESFSVTSTENGDTICGNLVLDDYDTLAELNEEWEDYEEPEGIKSVGTIGSSVHIKLKTEEEAEKAVEKLKAWKRLKDKGFRFDGWDENHHNLGIIEFSFSDVKKSVYDFKNDLDLLFGGEE